MTKRFLMIGGLALAGLLTGCSSAPDYSTSHFPEGREASAIKHGAKATFDAKHEIGVTVPAGTKKLRMWLAKPSAHEKAQKISNFKVEAPFPHKIVFDTRGNDFIYLEADNPPAGDHKVVSSWHHVSHEVNANIDASKTRAHTAEELKRLNYYLQDEINSKIDADIKAFAMEAVGKETNPVKASKLLYDAVLDKIEYWVKDTSKMKATGTGDARKTWDTCAGNCTDFHSLYAAASRAVNIPVRSVYGSFFKTVNDGQDKDQSYHCWIEFHAPNLGWIPLDVAVADVYVEGTKPANEDSMNRTILTTATGWSAPDPKMVEYYFGNLENRRVTWHWGRDLVLNPKQDAPPLGWLFGAHIELDGQTVAQNKGWTRKLTFKEVK